MKLKYLILLLISFWCVPSFAQIRYIPVAAHSFNASLGGGAAMLFGDFKTKFFTPAGRVNVDYNIKPFLSAGLEAQYGMLTTSKINVPRIGGIHIDNNFFAANANVRLTWGKIFKPNPRSIPNGFYFGLGAGIIKNNAKPNRTEAQIQTVPVLVDGEKLTGTVFIVPVNVGMDIDLSSFTKARNLGININYQHSFSTDDHLDGFDVHVKTNKFPDSYGFLSVAIKYYFGRLKQAH